ncbi:MAG TPA: hypothetical protein DGH68_00865, partial [Bacteroidetes bacterium]|nr:hypothetical protein [Bacteroidota bacterium]
MSLHLFLLATFVNIASGTILPDSTLATPFESLENHSFARPTEAEVKHIELDLKVDFTKKVLA